MSPEKLDPEPTKQKTGESFSSSTAPVTHLAIRTGSDEWQCGGCNPLPTQASLLTGLGYKYPGFATPGHWVRGCSDSSEGLTSA